jgi:hypothetical protein
MNTSLLPGITQLLDNGAPLHYPVKRLDATLDAKPTSQNPFRRTRIRVIEFRARDYREARFGAKIPGIRSAITKLKSCS